LAPLHLVYNTSTCNIENGLKSYGRREKQRFSIKQSMMGIDASLFMCTAQERLEMFAFKTRYTPKKASAGFAVKSNPHLHCYKVFK